MYDPKRSFKILFFLGASILLMGVAFIVVPDSMISGLTEQLNHETSNSERASLEKALFTQNIDRTTVYQPFSIILIVLGTLVIAYASLSTIFNLAYKNPTEKMEKKLQLSEKKSTKIFEETKSSSNINPKLDSISPETELTFEEKIKTLKSELGDKEKMEQKSPQLEKETSVSPKKDLELLNKQEEIVFNETVILENKKGTKLYKDRLIYEGSSYLISDMKQASAKSGFFELPSLSILFKNGEEREFQVGSASSTSMVNQLFSDGTIDFVSGDYKVAAQQWAAAINTLIVMSNK
jgi:hypothetical protein